MLALRPLAAPRALPIVTCVWEMSARERSKRAVDVWLVCSSGGHLMQLAALEEAWSGRSHVWVSNDQSDARSLLRDEESYFLPGPYSRDARSFVRNLVFAARLVRRRPPRILITTGADIAVPLALVARLSGARVVYVESFTRIHTPSLSGRLIALFASRVYVQWPELVPTLRGARFAGAVVEA